MSLLGALNLGSTSLSAQQAALQVTGSNIANANTAGYSRQTATLKNQAPELVGNHLYVGSGVNVTSIERAVNESLNASTRDAMTSQQQASSMQDYLTQLESTFGTLNDGDLSSQMSSFFNGIQTLSDNVQNTAQKSVVIQSGVNLANYIQNLRTNILNVRNDAEAQIKTQVQQADALASKIAKLNGQISVAEVGGSKANSLRDERDQALTDLSKIINIKAIDQGSGQITVLVGNGTLVQGTKSRGISTSMSNDATGKLPQTNLVYGDNGDTVNITGGSLGGLLTARDESIAEALSTLDKVTSTLITTVNQIHSSGQGSSGFSNVTGTTAVKSSTLALNSAADSTGLPSVPTNGSFDITVKDLTTGTMTTRTIQVDFSGTPPTSLSSLATSITNGSIVASVDSSGHLNIKSNDPNNTFTFSNDTSGTLAALGVNTFFTGTNAETIGVNGTLTSNSALLATGQKNESGSNANALALANCYTTATTLLGGSNISAYYSQYIGDLATKSASAQDDYTAQTAVVNTLSTQKQAISGVDMDEEAINLIKYQRAFEGSARFITVVNEMMQTVLNMAR